MSRLITNYVHAITSATDNALVRWDATTGRFVQNSSFILDDSGNLAASTTITLGKITWNNTNSFISAQDMSFTVGDGYDMNFSSGATSGNINFVAFGGAVNIVANQDCTFGSASGAFLLTAATGIDITSTTDNVHLTAALKIILDSSSDINLTAAGTFNISAPTSVSTNSIFFGASQEGQVFHDSVGFVFNPKTSGTAEMVIGSNSTTADANLRVFRMGVGGSATSGTAFINCAVTGNVRTALNFNMTATSGTVLAPLVLNTIDSSSGTAIVFANTIEYTLNTTTHTGANSMESIRITMGTGAGILIPATTVYMRGITIDLTGKGVGGTHVAAAVIRQTGLFQRRMTAYGGTATTDTNGCYWGDDVVIQAGSKVLYNGSESSGGTSLTITKSNVYDVYDTGTTELQRFVGGVKVISSTSALNTLLVNTTLSDAVNLAVGSTTGTKIGTATTQKLSFFNSTPIVQPANTTDLRTALINLGLYASGGASPLDLNGGAFTTSGVATLSNTTDSTSNTTGGVKLSGGMGVVKSIFAGGDIACDVAGKGFRVKEGSNAKMGTAVLVGGTVVVSTTAVTASSRIFITINVAGGTVGAIYISARTAGTSFTITSLNILDTSTVAWILMEPA